MTVLLPSTVETNLAVFALSLQQLAAGRSNASGSVTLATGASTTVVSAINCSPTSAVFLFPKTADAAGSAALPAFSVKKQIFTASGTYTPSAGMVYCISEGAGSGGGGGAVVCTTGDSLVAGGGGSGGYSRVVASAATIGVSQAVTIGNAGVGGAAGSNNGTDGSDCSLGALLVAKGGKGGAFISRSSVGTGGAGGVAGTGDLVAAGVPGGGGFYNAARATTGVVSTFGVGGSSFFGGGAVLPVLTAGGSSSGVNAGNYGSGGSGGYVDAIAASVKGGDGSKGVIFITEFCFAGAAAPTFVSSVGKQTFTISHDNTAVADRSFFYLCLG